jgi:hypothetical protein
MQAAETCLPGQKQQRCEIFVEFDDNAFSRCSAPKYFGALHLETLG